MTNKGIALLGALITVGTVGMVVVMTKGTKAKVPVPPPVFVPTAGEISEAESLAKLNAYYDLINELLISGEINQQTYQTLYETYEEKFYELMEGTS